MQLTESMLIHTCTRTRIYTQPSQKGCVRGVRAVQREISERSAASVVIGLLWLRLQPDQVVDAQDGDGRLRGKLNDLGLAEGGLQHTRGNVVPDAACRQVQTALQQGGKVGKVGKVGDGRQTWGAPRRKDEGQNNNIVFTAADCDSEALHWYGTTLAGEHTPHTPTPPPPPHRCMHSSSRLWAGRQAGTGLHHASLTRASSFFSGLVCAV